MTVAMASLAARICPETCSAERTMTSSSFSTLSAISRSCSDAAFAPQTSCHEPMLIWCRVHVFVELNYPHIIGFSGYELHHDVATFARINPGNRSHHLTKSS